jgi:hypothetical protein
MIAKYRCNLKLVKPLFTQLRHIQVRYRQNFRAAMDFAFVGDHDFAGLGPIVDDTTVTAEYEGEPRKNTYGSL